MKDWLLKASEFVELQRLQTEATEIALPTFVRRDGERWEVRAPANKEHDPADVVAGYTILETVLVKPGVTMREDALNAKYVSALLNAAPGLFAAYERGQVAEETRAGDVAQIRDERDALAAELANPVARPVTFQSRAADALADEVAVLVRRRILDARSPAADALLDYRSPPSSPRADRLAALERQVAQIVPAARVGPDCNEKDGWCGECALCRMREERDEALRLAYPGEHRFPDRSWKAIADDMHVDIVTLRAELAEARATNTKLNRRLQTAEAGVKDNLEACRAAGVPFGRRLALAAAEMYRRPLEEMKVHAKTLLTILDDTYPPGVDPEIWSAIQVACRKLLALE